MKNLNPQGIKNRICVGLSLFLIAVFFSGCSDLSSDTGAQTPTATITETATSSETVTETATETASATATASATPDAAATGAGAPLTVHYIDVGQADSILLELPNGETMLIDGGNRADGDDVTAYIEQKGIETIDYLVATHPHEDHIGGLPDVIDSPITVEAVYMPQVTATTQVYKALTTSIAEEGAAKTRAQSGTRILDSPNLHIGLVAPSADDDSKNLNDWSAVVRLEYGETSFLFLGDAERDEEADITADIDVDVLKVGHHGSDTSTTEALLDKTTPAYAVISVGEGNTYGHPDPLALALLAEHDVRVYRTDLQGTITITSDGTAITADHEPIPYNPQTDGATAAPLTEAPDAAPATLSDPPGLPSLLPDGAETVYVTATGKTYHRDGCVYLKNSKIAMTLADAKLAHTPCSVCDPPE